MIGIKLDGDDEFLELDPDTSISLKLENPILGDGDKISPGSYSFPFDIPGGTASPKNAARLKYPHVLENNEAYQLQNATLYWGGLPFKQGTLKGKSSVGNRIPANFLFGLSQVSPEFKTAKLRDVINEVITIDDTAITKIIYVKRLIGGDWVVTVNGVTYTGATANDIKTQMITAYWASLDSGKYVATCEEITVGNSPSGLITPTYLKIYLSLRYTYFDPELEMDFFLDQVSTDPLHELHVTVDDPNDYSIESFDMDEYYDAFSAFMAGYISGAYPTDKFRFPVAFNADPYGSTERIKESELVNGVNSGGLIRNAANVALSGTNRIRNYNSQQPFIRLKWVLDQLATAFGFELEGDFYDHADVANMLLHNTASLDVVQSYIGDKKFVFWRRSFNISELVPDISVVDFFAALQSRYNIAEYYSDNTLKVRMQLREGIAKNQGYRDITSISSPPQGNEEMRVTGFTLRCPKEDGDVLSVEDKITIGTSEKEYPVKCGSIRQTQATVIEDQTLVGVRVSQKNGEKFGMRVFYYQGIFEGPEFNYPKAGTDGVTFYEQLNNNILLIGLYETCWKYWLHFEQNRRLCNVNVNYPFRMLNNFDWEQKDRYDRLNFIVKSISVRLKTTGIEVSQVELLTMS